MKYVKEFLRRGTMADWGGPVILAIATIIQMAVLYLDYLLFYRLNGWVPNEGLITFTVIFVAVFVAVWLIVYFCAVRPSVRKLNDKLNAEK